MVRRDQILRYLLVGMANTILGYALFAALYTTIGDEVHYLIILVIVTFVAIVFGFVGYRLFVFRVTGHLVRDFVRFSGVYVVILVANLVILPVLVEAAGIPVLIAQPLAAIGTAATGFLANRHYSFRRR